VPIISHVINYGLPMKAEDYVHRIGRAGRAGRDGLAVMLAEARDAGMIRRILVFTTQPIEVAMVAGLEPRKPAPQTTAARAKLGAGPKRFDRKPRFGQNRPACRPAGDFKAKRAGGSTR
jgi:superfamily II DNA/RNA helicase